MLFTPGSEIPATVLVSEAGSATDRALTGLTASGRPAQSSDPFGRQLDHPIFGGALDQPAAQQLSQLGSGGAGAAGSTSSQRTTDMLNKVWTNHRGMPGFGSNENPGGGNPPNGPRGSGGPATFVPLPPAVWGGAAALAGMAGVAFRRRRSGLAH